MIVDRAWRRGTDRGTTCGSVDSAQWSRTVTANSGGWARARSVPGLNNCAERRFRAATMSEVLGVTRRPDHPAMSGVLSAVYGAAGSTLQPAQAQHGELSSVVPVAARPGHGSHLTSPAASFRTL